MRALTFIITMAIVMSCCHQQNSSEKPTPYPTSNVLENTQKKACTTDTTTKNDELPVGQTMPFKLCKDDGYILKETGLSFLLSLGLTDTLPSSSWNIHKTGEIIGKYYKSSVPSHYIMCLTDFSAKYDFETHILFELEKMDDTAVKIIAIDRYLHYNYSCCWHNSHDGFGKLGDFFFIRTCNTGSGYCSSTMRFFQSVVPKNLLQKMRENVYSHFETGKVLLNSTMQIKGNKLTLTYREETIEFDRNENPLKRNVEHYKVVYWFKNNQWITDDSTVINQHYNGGEFYGG